MIVGYGPTSMVSTGKQTHQCVITYKGLGSLFVYLFVYCYFAHVEECDYSKLQNFISSKSDSGVSYSIPLISESEVLNTFKSLASNKASGHDSLSTRILKVCSSQLFNPLYKLINL